MDKEQIIQSIIGEIKGDFENDSSGHDWFHIERVWKLAKQIAIKEKTDVFLTELGALLHDIADHKFVENHEVETQVRVENILNRYSLDKDIIKNVIHIVLHCSFKGGVEKNKMNLLEGKIVQDADKLDAIGAIGIARTFAFGGKFGSLMYHPDINPINHKSLESYQKNRTHTINHFYEKLLLLKDLMYTQTAKEIANNRHLFMENFLKEFYKEWEAKI